MLEKLIDIEKNERKKYFQKRIVAEMKFAMVLSEKEHGKFDDVIREAEQYISEATTEDGIITREIMEHAEKILMPVSASAKEYILYCAAHAHIDMNWKWGWDETVSVVVETTKSILKIMEEYPDFKFSQSQASIYKILEDYAPELLAQVKERVKEGRWEVSASTWVEADKNMPSSESAAKQIFYAKRYLSDLLDISLDDMILDFEPDTFGHSVNVPEILRNANIKYYYHCRGMNDCEYQLYIWRAPSGAEVLVNRERNFYFVNVSTDMALHAFSNSELSGVKKTLHVYGVGDHGGGPTRRDVERLIDMNRWPIYPSFKMATYREFFEAVEEYRDQLPVFEGEMNFIFDGCFTSQSRNKNGNRRSEELIYKTEVFSALAATEGNAYPRRMMEDTWRKILLNQFHDIVTGSGVRATREYALGMYQDVKAAADCMRNRAYHYIAEHINTELVVKEEEISRNAPDLARAYGAGVGSGQVERGSGNTRIFHIFNPTRRQRTEGVEMLLWEWYGDPDRLEIIDAEGNPVEYQILDSGMHTFYYHNYMKLLLKLTVPGYGYTTIKLTEGELKRLPVKFHWERRKQEEERLILENELLRVEFDKCDASIRSVMNKETGKELIDTSRKTGIFQYIVEASHRAVCDWRTEMSSWLTGRFKTVETVNQNLEVQMTDGMPDHPVVMYNWRVIERPQVKRGTLRNTLSYTTNFHNSRIKVDVSLDTGSRRLNYKVECDWHEIGRPETGVPRLQFLMPVPFQDPVYLQDIPFGIAQRRELGVDTPGMSFTAVFGKDSGHGLAISSRNTYGYRCEDQSVALALLRSSSEPDPYPENGICNSEFCVAFLDERPSNSELIQYFQEYNCRMDVISGSRHSGSLAPQKSYLNVENDGIMISTIKEAEDSDEIVLRLYEVDGKAQKAVVCMEKEIKAACRIDLLERELDPLKVEGNQVEIALSPYEITAVKVRL